MIINKENKIIYVGNGVTTEWPFDFRILRKEDLRVGIIKEDKTTLLTSGYFVDMDGAKVLYPGYPPGQAPPENERPPRLAPGERLVIYREIDITQEVDLGENWPMPMVEGMSDKLTMILQNQKEEIDRAVKVDVGSTETPEELRDRIFEAEQNALDAVAESREISRQVAVTKTAMDAELQEAVEAANTAISNANASAESAQQAKTHEDETRLLAERAENAASGVLSVSSTIYDPNKTYNFPDTVVAPDGHTYRCVQTSQGEDPATSIKWVEVAVVLSETFEYDENGDLMPRYNPRMSQKWRIDDDGNIMPNQQ